MTRINLIPPRELHRKFLQAEYYELPEIFRLVDSRQKAGWTPASIDIPNAYCFGTGHKRFFYNKLRFLADRHLNLVAEMRMRGFAANIQPLRETFGHLRIWWWGDWDPPEEAIALSRERIQQRIKELGL